MQWKLTYTWDSQATGLQWKPARSEDDTLDSSVMTLLGNVSRHQPLPTNADQPVASSAYITVSAGLRASEDAVKPNQHD
jgi:hypothetical protein